MATRMRESFVTISSRPKRKAATGEAYVRRTHLTGNSPADAPSYLFPFPAWTSPPALICAFAFGLTFATSGTFEPFGDTRT